MEKQLEYYYKNKDTINARRRAYRAAHKSEVNLKAKVYRATRKEEIRRYNNAYAKKRYRGIRGIDTASIIAELEKRRPKGDCTKECKTWNCHGCLWMVKKFSDNFKENKHD